MARHMRDETQALRALIAASATSDLDATLRRIAERLAELSQTPEWSLLAVELQLYAQRDAEFAARYDDAKAAYHAEFAAALDELVQRYRLRPALPSLQMAIGLYALWCGFAVQGTVAAAIPRGEMLLAFFRAVTGAASHLDPLRRRRLTRSHLDPATSQVWLVGGGIASMAAAVFLIRDAGMPAAHIHILEEFDVAGGSLDGAKSPVQAGFVTRGGRMLEEEAYQTLWNLLELDPLARRPERDDPPGGARLQRQGEDRSPRPPDRPQPQNRQRRRIRLHHPRPPRDDAPARHLGAPARRAPHRRDVLRAFLLDQLLADVAHHLRLPELAQRHRAEALHAALHPGIPADAHARWGSPDEVQPVRFDRPADAALAGRQGRRRALRAPGSSTSISTRAIPTTAASRACTFGPRTASRRSTSAATTSRCSPSARSPPTPASAATTPSPN